MNEEIDKILKYGRELGFPLIKDDAVVLLIDSVKKYKPQKILEIGTAIGYSGSQMLFASENSKLVTIEKNSESVKMAEQNFAKLGLTDRVTLVNCDAQEYLNTCNEKFDFIFLDGPKGQYLHYKEQLINLLNDGGVLFTDNVLFRGYVKGEIEFPHRFKTIVVNLRKYLSEIQNDDRITTTVYEIGDGVSISIKKLN